MKKPHPTYIDFNSVHAYHFIQALLNKSMYFILFLMVLNMLCAKFQVTEDFRHNRNRILEDAAWRRSSSSLAKDCWYLN